MKPERLVQGLVVDKDGEKCEDIEKVNLWFVSEGYAIKYET